MEGPRGTIGAKPISGRYSIWMGFIYPDSACILLLYVERLLSYASPGQRFDRKRGKPFAHPQPQAPRRTPDCDRVISRLAYARAQAAGIEMYLLLTKAGLTGQQIRDPDSRSRWIRSGS
jgi:hypothetical protein